MVDDPLLGAFDPRYGGFFVSPMARGSINVGDSAIALWDHFCECFCSWRVVVVCAMTFGRLSDWLYRAGFASAFGFAFNLPRVDLLLLSNAAYELLSICRGVGLYFYEV
ncbi:hypothetical protein Nepgr_023196 [Nepenthes gracilis]|uniref:Uncharacterized protein n=1 Tax=Nepenthes gracilis TaxID=150966 RepID=A0AAD3T2E2_NEPGR|nr:hypothetical protein Nepgr_023196 [Nepenthes gracilis]